jgi:hypothetical protein
MLTGIEASKHRSVRWDGPLRWSVGMLKKRCVSGKFVKTTRRWLPISITGQSINTLSVKNEEHDIQAWIQNALPFFSAKFLIPSGKRDKNMYLGHLGFGSIQL